MGSEDEIDVASNHAEQCGSHPNSEVANNTDGGKPRKTISIREKLQNPDYRRNVRRTLWLGASFWALVGILF